MGQIIFSAKENDIFIQLLQYYKLELEMSKHIYVYVDIFLLETMLCYIIVSITYTMVWFSWNIEKPIFSHYIQLHYNNTIFADYSIICSEVY